MNATKKLLTLGRLLAGGDSKQVRNRVRYNWLLLRSWLSRGQPFVYRQAGIRYVCYPDNSESRIVAASAPTDRVELAVLRRWLEAGDTFLDAGANVGTYTFAAAKSVAPRGRVLAIDAGRQMSALLTETARRLGYTHVHCLQVAIGNRDGTARFFEGLSEGTSFIQSLRPSEAGASAFAERSVEMLTLNTIAARHLPSTPAVVKIDIEGAEGDALDAAPPGWFAAAGPLWIMEINPRALQAFERTPAELALRFPSAAFQTWLVPKELHASGAEGKPRLHSPTETWTDSKYYNLIAIPRAKRFANRAGRIRAVLA